jgi:hypothetical protein
MVAREFDACGRCMTEIITHLERQNPELLDMAVAGALTLVPRESKERRATAWRAK